MAKCKALDRHKDSPSNSRNSIASHLKTIVHMQTNSIFSPQEARCGFFLFFQGTFPIFQGTLPATIGRWSRGHRAVVAGKVWEKNGNLGFGNDLLCACLEYILSKKGWGVRTQQKSNVPQAAWGDRNRQFLLFMEIEMRKTRYLWK